MLLQGRWDMAVHPHARGEHEPTRVDSMRVIGPSPRAWGTLPLGNRHRLPRRSIPTRVGNTSASSSAPSSTSVHPHARGEHATHETEIAEYKVHPHARGEHAPSHVVGDAVARSIPTRVGNTNVLNPSPFARAGPSPRAWGTQQRALLGRHSARSIPTRVGNTHACRDAQGWAPGPSPRAWGTRSGKNVAGLDRAVHPHARGEHLTTCSAAAWMIGPSPRAWGTPPVSWLSLVTSRSIPTRVGNTP